jgi:ABC-type glycerol-3-phosphate transport system substrate-binding protein
VRSAKKYLAVVCAAFATAGVLAGCGSSGGNAGNTSANTAGSTGAATTPAGSSSSSSSLPDLSGTSFNILGQWTGGEQKAFQAVIDLFDQKTGATGHYQAAAGGNEAGVLATKVTGGQPPDIAMLALPGAISQYAKSGDAKPLGSKVADAVAANYASVWTKLATVDGKLYGVPFDASNKSTVWYNTNLFSTAGISSPPTTWDDMINDAKTLSAAGVPVPISIGGGDGWTLTDWFENVYIQTAGLDNYDKLTAHQIPWTDPTVTKALNILKQLWGDKSLIGSPSKALQTPFTASVDNVFKKNPTSAIVYEGSFVATTITSDKNPAVVGKDAKFFGFPTVSGGTPALVGGGDFAVAFTDNKANEAFLQFLATPEAVQALVSAPGSGFLSANKNVPSSAYPDDTSAQLAKQMVDAGDNFRFDMSDQTPAAFGGTPNQGEWGDLQNFLKTGNVAATQQSLEANAKKAYK